MSMAKATIITTIAMRLPGMSCSVIWLSKNGKGGDPSGSPPAAPLCGGEGCTTPPTPSIRNWSVAHVFECGVVEDFDLADRLQSNDPLVLEGAQDARHRLEGDAQVV